MKKETIGKVKEMIDLNEVMEGEIVSSVSGQDMVEKAKDRTLEFLMRSYSAVEGDRALKKKVAEIMSMQLDREVVKIQNNEPDTISINQLAGLFQLLGADATAAQDSLLQILKPVPNTVNPWIEKRAEDLASNKAFADITSKEMQTVTALGDFLNMLAEQGKAISEKKKEEEPKS